MQNPVTTVKTAVARRKTKILVTALVVTTTAAVIEYYGLKQHDAFLRLNGLYDAFYEITE